MVKFSLIIPVYNVSRYLADCLDSVLHQDLDCKFYEIIVIDDCSPFGEKVIIDRYMEKNFNIKYIRHDVNKRQGGARNTGMLAASGEYIMFLDADDCLLYQNTLSILMQCVNNNNPIILRSESFSLFPNDSSYQKVKGVFLGEVACKSLDFEQWITSPNFSCSSCSTLYNREFLLNNNLFFRENVLYEDTDWTQKTMYHASIIDFIDFEYYGYRESFDSTTRGCSDGAYEGNVLGVIETYRFYKTIDVRDLFKTTLQERFVNAAIELLLLGRNYSLPVCFYAVILLNNSGITSLKSHSFMRNIVLMLIRYMPWLPIIAIKIMFTFKRMLRL